MAFYSSPDRPRSPPCHDHASGRANIPANKRGALRVKAARVGRREVNGSSRATLRCDARPLSHSVKADDCLPRQAAQDARHGPMMPPDVPASPPPRGRAARRACCQVFGNNPAGAQSRAELARGLVPICCQKNVLIGNTWAFMGCKVFSVMK